jgi:hypothetical protein
VGRKEVREVQLCHVLLKFVPLERFTEGKVAREVLSLHAWEKLMLSLPVVLKVTAGKDVSPVQPFHAWVKLVPLARFT